MAAQRYLHRVLEVRQSCGLLQGQWRIHHHLQVGVRAGGRARERAAAVGGRRPGGVVRLQTLHHRTTEVRQAVVAKETAAWRRQHALLQEAAEAFGSQTASTITPRALCCAQRGIQEASPGVV